MLYVRYLNIDNIFYNIYITNDQKNDCKRKKCHLKRGLKIKALYTVVKISIYYKDFSLSQTKNGNHDQITAWTIQL